MIKTPSNVYFDETGKEYYKPRQVRLQLRLSGYVFVKLGDTRILMVQPTWNTTWELPGGKIEINESIHEGIARECYEETGCEIEINNQPIWVGERNFYNKTANIKNKFYKAIIMIYPGYLLNKIQNRKITNIPENGEITKAEWVKQDTLNECNVHDIFWPIIRSSLTYCKIRKYHSDK